MDHPHKDPRPSKKHHPKALPILHEDRDILVVEKPAGLLTIGTEREKVRTAHYILNEYVRRGDPRSRNRVYVVHRLDKDTSGILLFAKSEEAKKFLQDHWDQAEKHYVAIVHGEMAEKEGVISSYLAENAAHKVYSTSDATKGKLSHTSYKVLRESNGFSLVEIQLLTGRKHQIRVHFADKGHPVVGDKKYGSGEPVSKRLALHARSIYFIHPFSGKHMTFDLGMPKGFLGLLGRL